MLSSRRRVIIVFPLLLILSFAVIGGCDNDNGADTIVRTIIIDPDDDSCIPASSEFRDCAEACEVNALGCAMDILEHIQSDAFISRRQLYPGITAEQKPNIQTPMHGLFVPTWNNLQLNVAINAALENPFAEINMPPWSISVKLNNNPGVTDNSDLNKLDWTTPMYKIPGYCPERIFPTPDAPCKGGEWFWFLYRDGFLSFDFDSQNDSSVPAWGKAETFCLDCHGAVADADWLWITHDLVRRQQELQKPITNDGQTPGLTGAAFCDDVTALSPDRPQDVLFDPASVSVDIVQRMFDCYAWETFVALNWPVKADERGVPDTTKSISDGGDRVWETYKQVYEVFQPLDPKWTLDDKNWDDPQPLPQVCINALEEAGISPDDFMTFQVLNETHQAFGNQFDNLVDQNGNIAHYNVRINRDEFEFMKTNGFADSGTYDYNGPFGINKREFMLPDNINGATGEGTTELKSAWKIMCTDAENCNTVDDPSRYYSRTALIYTPPTTKTIDPFTEYSQLPPPTITVPASCRVAEVGLIGFHIEVKTFWAPQSIWPTFEHIDNVPGNTTEGIDDGSPETFSFFDTQCLTPPDEFCLEQRPGIIPLNAIDDPSLFCCENLQNIVNSRPHPANASLLPVIPPDLIPIPNQQTRIDPVQETADELNKIFRTLLKKAGSPFQNYVLVSTQWPGAGRQSESSDGSFAIRNKLCLQGDNPITCFTFQPPGLRLRNTVIESYQASYCAPEDEDIGNDPVNCTPEKVKIDPLQSSSGGCMNCHFSSGTDSSFIWADGLE